MHIPDGFISPRLYLPLYAVGAVAWVYGVRRLKRELDERTIPLLAVLAAFVFVLMLVAVPLPGGTTAHASGVGLLAVLFGVWGAFMAVSLVLLLQALLLGAGGITALPVNALAIGLAGAAAARLAYAGLRGWSANGALFVAGWLAVVVPALLAALALGVQPLIAADAQGHPLFFPFGLAVTLPAVVLPHLLIGVGEGMLTVALHGFVQRFAPRHGP